MENVNADLMPIGFTVAKEVRGAKKLPGSLWKK